MDWNAAALSALAGGVISLLFAYVPYLKDWYDECDPRFKPLIQAAVLLVVALGRQVVVCDLDWSCVYLGLGDTTGIWLAALIGNQTTFAVGVKQFKRTYWFAQESAGMTDAEMDARIGGKPTE